MANIDQKPKDENGKAHGEWLFYHDNGQLMYRHNFFHGAAHELEESYYDDGRLNYRGYWNMGIKIGYWYHSILPKKYFLCII